MSDAQNSVLHFKIGNGFLFIQKKPMRKKPKIKLIQLFHSVKKVRFIGGQNTFAGDIVWIGSG